MDLIKNVKSVNRATVNNIVAFLEKKIEDGELSGLKAITYVKFFNEIGKKLKDSVVIKNQAFAEGNTYSEKEDIILNSCEIKQRSKMTPSYDNTPEIVRLDEKLKEMKKLANLCKKPTEYIDKETGEVVIINPAIKRYTDYFEVKLPL